MRRRAVALAGLLAVIALIGFAISSAFGGSNGPSSTTSTTTTVTTPKVKQLEIGLRTFSFTDASRTTYNYSTGKTAIGRTIGIEVRYPTFAGVVGKETSNAAISSRKSYPIIVLAPGYRLRPEDYSVLLDSWVKAGFMVAALEFPNTTYPASEPPYRANLPHGSPESDMYGNEPGDVAFALKELTAATATKGNWLNGLIDTKAINLAGHSDGGDVMAALIYDAAKAVPRVSVKSVAVLSGAEFPIANQTYAQPSTGTVPLLVVQSATDLCNSPNSAVQLYNTIGAPKYFLKITNATHLGPYNGADAQAAVVVQKTTTAFFQEAMTSALSTETLTEDASDPGISSLLTTTTLAPIPTPSGTASCPVD